MTYKYKKKRALIFKGLEQLNRKFPMIKIVFNHAYFNTKILEVNMYSFGYINKLDNVPR